VDIGARYPNEEDSKIRLREGGEGRGGEGSH